MGGGTALSNPFDLLNAFVVQSRSSKELLSVVDCPWDSMEKGLPLFHQEYHEPDFKPALQKNSTRKLQRYSCHSGSFSNTHR